jgi:hypothetical protein
MSINSGVSFSEYEVTKKNLFILLGSLPEGHDICTAIKAGWQLVRVEPRLNEYAVTVGLQHDDYHIQYVISYHYLKQQLVPMSHKYDPGAHLKLPPNLMAVPAIPTMHNLDHKFHGVDMGAKEKPYKKGIIEPQIVELQDRVDMLEGMLKGCLDRIQALEDAVLKPKYYSTDSDDPPF